MDTILSLTLSMLMARFCWTVPYAFFLYYFLCSLVSFICRLAAEVGGLACLLCVAGGGGGNGSSVGFLDSEPAGLFHWGLLSLGTFFLDWPDFSIEKCSSLPRGWGYGSLMEEEGLGLCPPQLSTEPWLSVDLVSPSQETPVWPSHQ